MVERKEQILPVRIGLFDQANLPGAFPFLDLVFPRLRRLSRIVRFHPDKSLDVMLAGMGRAAAFPMGQHTGPKIIRMARIQCAILPIGHDVCIERHASPPETAALEPYLPQAKRKRLAPSLTSEDTCAGRYPSADAASCTIWKGSEMAPCLRRGLRQVGCDGEKATQKGRPIYQKLSPSETSLNLGLGQNQHESLVRSWRSVQIHAPARLAHIVLSRRMQILFGRHQSLVSAFSL